MSRFARRLSQAWGRLALPADGRVLVAVSGGADSTALLLAFDELIKARRLALALRVAHLDHELRGEASAGDARFVAELASALGYEATIGRAPVERRAGATRDNLEQAARRERYEFLGGAARAWGACAVAVAHTVEDQAETLLLALLRGSGARGLGGMRDRRAFDERGDELRLVRPLLDWARRAETGAYCAARGIAVRADEMNDDERFARVRVRRQLLPLLATFNPRAVETLARTAGLLRAQADALEHQGETLLVEAGRDALLKAEAKRVDDAARGHGGLAVDEKNAHANAHDTLTDARDALTDARDALVDENDAPADALDASVDAFDVLVDTHAAFADVHVACAADSAPPLSVEVLRAADGAVLSYALRGWIKSGRGNLRRIEATHIEAIARLLDGARGGRVAELPGGAWVERRRGLLLFHAGARRAGKS